MPDNFDKVLIVDWFCIYDMCLDKTCTKAIKLGLHSTANAHTNLFGLTPFSNINVFLAWNSRENYTTWRFCGEKYVYLKNASSSLLPLLILARLILLLLLKKNRSLLWPLLWSANWKEIETSCVAKSTWHHSLLPWSNKVTEACFSFPTNSNCLWLLEFVVTNLNVQHRI